MVLKKRGCLGSITIEACISLPVFLLFFYLLLFLVRAACINLVLDHAISETARYFAGLSYPLSILNEYKDEKTEGAAMAVNKLPDDLLKTLFLPGEMQLNKVDLIAGILKENAGHNLPGGLGLKMAETLHKEYQSLQDTGIYYLAEQVLFRQLQDSGVDKDKLSLILVKFPEGRGEYAGKCSEGFYRHVDLQPERDFNRDDVVIMAEYFLEFPLSFISRENIIFRYAAIERAWLKGASGVYTGDEEGLDSLQDNKEKEYVYITRTGSKYHLYSTCAYLEKSSIPITKADAEKRGLTPHMGCPHRFE